MGSEETGIRWGGRQGPRQRRPKRVDFIQRQEGPHLSPSEILTESTVENITLEAKREQGGGGRGAGYKAVQRMV